MTDYRQPWERPLDAMLGIPVCVDPEVPAGTAVLVLDPEEPRHITRISVRDGNEPMPSTLTDEQMEQVRDHYRAMNERAARALVDYRRLMERLTSEPPVDPFLTDPRLRELHPVLGPQITAMRCIDPKNLIRVTGI